MVYYESNILYHNSQCYLDKKRYKSNKWATDIINQVNTTFLNTKSNTFNHFHENKRNYLPIWALFEELTLGEVVTFIQQINSKYLTLWTRSCYPNNPEYSNSMNGFLNVLRVYRNKIAHGSRIYGSKVTFSPKIFRRTKKIYFPENGVENTQKLYLYGALYVYKHLLIDIDPELFSIWNSFLYDLKEKMDKNSFIDINNYGFPKEWYNILIIQFVCFRRFNR
ncbi:Abi family protein [Lactococcus carnosus]|uniref:Abi family protein n=1 Tax=Pseudolactococcus carnosus TaxID=2749961 RepID=UPI001C4FA4C2|nr:Abi family protein [Methanobrevibacter sp.]MCJ1971423.1 Abi family protein [Lactococcus carnosus]MCJ1979699.1 Abi family protein [Lactococcus carnosus]